MALNIGELLVQISADTKGLNAAAADINKLTGPINKLISVVETLTKSIDNSSSQMAKGFIVVSDSARNTADNVKNSTKNVTDAINSQNTAIQQSGQVSDSASKTIIAATIRQEQAMSRAGESVKNLVQDLSKFRGSAPLIDRAKVAIEEYNKALSSGTLTSKQMSDAQIKLRTELGSIKRDAKQANIPVGDFSYWIQDATKSIQLALGPLSGYASRLTALAALFNRNTLAIAGVFAGITGLSVITHRATTAGVEYEKTMARIQGQLETTGYAAGVTSEQLDIMAKKLAIDTLASTQGAREAVSALLTFPSIFGKNLERTLFIAQGISDTIGGDLLSNVRKIGKALQDPDKYFRSLQELGISFTKTEKERLKVLVEQGDKLKAQEAIFKKLEGRGFASAGVNQATNTLAGSLDTVNERWTQFLEKLSQASGLLPEFKQAVDRVSAVLKGFTDSLDKGNVAIAAFGKTIGFFANAGASAFENLGSILSGLAFGIIGLQIAKVVQGVATFSIAVKAATGVTAIFNAVLRANPLIFIGSAIVGVITYLYQYKRATAEVAAQQKELNKDLQDTTNLFGENLVAALVHNIGIAKANLVELQKKELAVLNIRATDPAAGLKGLFGVGEDVENLNAVTEAIHARQTQISDLEDQLKTATATWEQFRKTQAELNQQHDLPEMTKQVKDYITSIVSLITTYNSAAGSVAKLANDQRLLSKYIDENGRITITAKQYAEAYNVTIQEAESDLNRLNKALKGVQVTLANSDPIVTAQRQILNLTKSVNDLSLSLGMGISVDFSSDLERNLKSLNIEKQVSDIINNLIDETDINKLIDVAANIGVTGFIDESDINGVKKAIEDQVRFILQKTEELNRLEPLKTFLLPVDENQRSLQEIQIQYDEYRAYAIKNMDIVVAHFGSIQKFMTEISRRENEERRKIEEQIFRDQHVEAIQAAQNIMSAFSDFMFDPFDKGLKGMLLSWNDTIRRMLTDQLTKQLFKFVGEWLSGSGIPGGKEIGAIVTTVAGQRAAGGPMVSGKPYLVGEKGPEIVVPKVNSTVIPNNKLSQQSSQQTTTKDNVNIINVIDPSIVSNYFKSGDGNRTFVNLLKYNAGTVQQLAVR